MSRSAVLGSALFAATAAWLSLGTIGFASVDGPRLALLPVTPAAAAISLSAGLAVAVLAFRGASLVPTALLGLILLPWLPFSVPSAFLLWVSPLALIVWIAVLVLMLVSLPGFPRFVVSHPRRVSAAAAFIVFFLSAWRASPMVPGGDEPHYLIIAQSIVSDGDLTIEDVHRRGDYRAYFSGELAPHVQRRSRNGQIYSIHAPGLPALIAPAFAIGSYPAVVVFLVLLASAGSALAWHVAWLWSRREDAAWFAWASVTLPVTAVFQSFTVYPDGPGGVIALTGLWALLRGDEESRSGSTAARPWLLHGAALSLLPWLHSRFAALAACLGALILLRLSKTKNPAAKAVAFLSLPAASAVAWVGYFVAIYGSPDPSAPYAPGTGSFRWVPGGLAGLLLDQRFGLLTYAPVVAFAFLGLGRMLLRRPSRRVALELLFVVIPYLLTVTHFAMWWGGWSPPARFFAPILPLFAVPAAAMWTTMESRVGKLIASTALALTAVATVIVVGVDRGRLAFNSRDAPALWLEWFGRVADLASAAPMWAREADLPLFRAILVWLAIAAAGWAVLRFAERSGRFHDRVRLHTAAVGMLAVVVMTAASVVWSLEGANGRAIAVSQLQLLEAVSRHDRVFALQLGPLTRIAQSNVPGRIRIEQVRHPGRRPVGAETPPMFALPILPAGQYRIQLSGVTPRGWAMIGIAREPRDPFALRTVQLPSDAIDLTFPLPVRALVVRGDEDAWRAVRGLVVEPLAVFRPIDRLSDSVARRAVRYDESTVYFLDDRSFPEPEAFWVGGGRTSTIVLQPDTSRTAAVLRLRNAPVDNRVVLNVGDWRRELRMTAGEEQTIEVPMDTARGGAVLRVETSGGFRPAEHDPTSRDQRFLGLWVRVEKPI
jgi:hypothetical protein